MAFSGWTREAVLAYTAAFLDGEGSVGIHLASRPKGRGTQGYVLRVGLYNTDPRPLRAMHSIWGGSLQYCNPRKARRLPSWTWALSATKAASFLADVVPFLIIKRDRALLALEFQSNKSRQPSLGQGGVQDKTSQAEYYRRMAALQPNHHIRAQAALKRWGRTKNAGILQ